MLIQFGRLKLGRLKKTGKLLEVKDKYSIQLFFFSRYNCSCFITNQKDVTCPGEWNCKTTFVLIISIFEKKDFCMKLYFSRSKLYFSRF